MPEPNATDCPCGSGLPFAECCEPLLTGTREAATAEALMRSRYCAYVQRDADYLLHTWHPRTRPQAVHFESGLRWTGLQVLEKDAGGPEDVKGVVSFVAHFELRGEPGALQERSRFHRTGGHWRYLDGRTGNRTERAPTAPARNAPCPCGSGKKYKRCCGVDAR